MTYNYLDAIRKDMSIDPTRLSNLLHIAVDEYNKCMAHDEEIALPDGLSEELVRLLNHGAELALDRARVVRMVIEDNVNRLPIEKVPEQFREFHKDHKPVSKSGLWAALSDDRDSR